MLLLADPRPLVERLGPEFFRQAPERPGVYLMRDAADTVLYVGKAKNLRKRLATYRVANPDRLRRRHLRLLRAVMRIELQECPDEASALAREAKLLLELRPRFNRVGTWPSPRRFVAWRVTEDGLELAVMPEADADWRSYGPMGAGAFHLRAALLRLCWCAIHPQRGLAGMPAGWFKGRSPQTAVIPPCETTPTRFHEASKQLESLFAGNIQDFSAWVGQRTALQNHPFEVAVREADLETLSYCGKRTTR